MHLTSSPRRALGLVAVGAIGMSTAVLGVTGTASAAPTSFTFSTDPGAEVNYSNAKEVVIDGDCSVAWVLEGAAGGGSEGADSSLGAPGGSVTVTTKALAGDVFKLFAGIQGGDGNITDESAGTGGASSSGVAGAAGGDGAETPNSADPSIVDTYGGGGGSASVVTKGGALVASAKGGDGAGSPGTGGGAGLPDGTSVNTGNGVISGTVTCTTVDPIAPGAPTLAGYVQTGDGTAKFQFTPGAQGDAHPVSYQYQLDNGAWTAFTVGFTGNDDLTGTLTGLTNMKKYSLAVRATSSAGTSAASAPVTFAPFRPVAAPASVTASVGVTSVRISWTPAADATGTVKYEAFATPDGAQSSQDTAVCVTTGTSCTVAVKAGLAYGFGVAGVDALGNSGDRIFGDEPTAVVPASAISPTLPKSNGTLTSNAANGKVVAGSQVTISGTDFLPGSTVELIVYPTPVKLGEATVLSDGTFSATVTLPKGLENGVHNLVASGVDVNGNVRNLVVEVTVSGGTAVLALTGFSALPYAGAGALALLAGGGLLVAARRRQAA